MLFFVVMLLISLKVWVVLVGFAYAVLLSFYRKWFLQVQQFQSTLSHLPSTKFSIIIPARNEENNIAHCLQSIIQQQYPRELFEVIVIDDHSADKTAFIVSSFQEEYPFIKLLKLEENLQGKKINAYKKKAIEIAISKAKGDWIITTDADCLLHKDWLKLYDEFICNKNVVFVAAPVIFTKQPTVLSLFQQIDFMALQATTAAVVQAGLHSMCNGANLAYQKNAFDSVGGFKDIDNIASGDDMLLMNKLKLHYPNQIGYLYHPHALALTTPMPTWRAFINQRVRWASKSDQYKDKTLLPALVVVYLMNLNVLVCAVAACMNGSFLTYAVGLLALKIIVEWRFLKECFSFFGKIRLSSFMALQPLHIGYIIIAGWLGKFGSYSWKERQVQ